MMHTAASHIQSVMDVEAFFHCLVDELNFNFQLYKGFAGFVCL
jgi:hypothetical protein